MIKIKSVPNLWTSTTIGATRALFSNREFFFSINRAQSIVAETTVLRRQYISTSTLTFRIAGRKAEKNKGEKEQKIKGLPL